MQPSNGRIQKDLSGFVLRQSFHFNLPITQTVPPAGLSGLIFSLSLSSTVLHHTTPLSSRTPIFTAHPSSDSVPLNLSPESVFINHFPLFSHFLSSAYCFLLSCHAHNIHNAYFRIVYIDTRSKAIKEKQMLPPTVSPLKPKQTISHNM